MWIPRLEHRAPPSLESRHRRSNRAGAKQVLISRGPALEKEQHADDCGDDADPEDG